MNDTDLFTQVIPRLVAELNTASLILLVICVVSWVQLWRVTGRFIDHLQAQNEELKRDKYVLANGSLVGYQSAAGVSTKSGAAVT